MDLSIFLAKVGSIYLLILGLAMLFNTAYFKDIIRDLDNNAALFMLSGVLPLIIGSLIVVSHNVWEADWRVLITLVGWLALIKGSIRVLLPSGAKKLDAQVIQCKVTLKICSLIVLVLGLIFAYFGFMA